MLGKIVHNVYEVGFSNHLYQNTIGCRYLSTAANYVQNHITEWSKSHLFPRPLKVINKDEEVSNALDKEKAEKQERTKYGERRSDLKVFHELSLAQNIRKINRCTLLSQNAWNIYSEHFQNNEQFSENNSQGKFCGKGNNVYLRNEKKFFHTYQKQNNMKHKGIHINVSTLDINSRYELYTIKQTSLFSMNIQIRHFSQGKGDNKKKLQKNENQNEQNKEKRENVDNICTKKNTVKILRTCSEKDTEQKSHSLTKEVKHLKFIHAFHPSNVLNEKVKDKLPQKISSCQFNSIYRNSKSEVKSENNLKSFMGMSSKSDSKITFSASCDDSVHKSKITQEKGNKCNNEGKQTGETTKYCLELRKKEDRDCRKKCEPTENVSAKEKDPCAKKEQDVCTEKKKEDKLRTTKKIEKKPNVTKLKCSEVKKKKISKPIDIGCKRNIFERIYSTIKRLCETKKSKKEAPKKVVHKLILDDICKKKKDICKDKPKDIYEKKPKDICKEKPKNICEERPKDICEEKPKDICEEKPKDICKENPKMDKCREKPKDDPFKKNTTICRDICKGSDTSSHKGRCQHICDELEKKHTCDQIKKEVREPKKEKEKDICKNKKQKSKKQTHAKKIKIPSVKCGGKKTSRPMLSWIKRCMKKYEKCEKKSKESTRRKSSIKIGDCSPLRRFLSKRRRE